jgi:hypothetical protein
MQLRTRAWLFLSALVTAKATLCQSASYGYSQLAHHNGFTNNLFDAEGLSRVFAEVIAESGHNDDGKF